MYKIDKFSKLPKHQSLLDRAAKVITSDPRVIGLYVYGSQESDEYSDIDLTIFFKSEEERGSFKEDIEEITQRIGKVKAGTFYDLNLKLYLVIFGPEEIKVDIDFKLIYKDDNPYEYPVDIIYDPEGHLGKMIGEAPEFVVDINKVDLERRTKLFYIGLYYFINKIGRGELWRAFDILDIIRRGLLQDEDILARRLKKDYNMVEKKLNKERLSVLSKTLFSELTKEDLFKAMDAIFEYWDRFLKNKFKELELFPGEYAINMMEYYERKKKEILSL
ncbi:MAG: hypothetical protein ACXABJ_08785 [Candidatus Heimdallarchaeaceae archaeon]|jgi:hypothetical protein